MGRVIEIQTILLARNQTGVSWAEMARSLKVSVECISLWRRGKTKVPLHRWQSLARAIGVDPSDLSREAYNREFGEINRTPHAETAPLTATDSPPQPETPQTPIHAPEPQQPATAPLKGWFDEIFGDDDE